MVCEIYGGSQVPFKLEGLSSLSEESTGGTREVAPDVIFMKQFELFCGQFPTRCAWTGGAFGAVQLPLKAECFV